MNSTVVIQYGSRAAGAFAAYYFAGRKFGTGGAVLSIALGWLAAGFLADKLIAQAGFAGTAAAQLANPYGSGD